MDSVHKQASISCYVPHNLLFHYRILQLNRWKSFRVAELNFSSLENIYGWMVVLHGKAYCTGYFTGKVSWYRSICKNCETFPPRTICNIWYLLHSTSGIVTHLIQRQDCQLIAKQFCYLTMSLAGYIGMQLYALQLNALNSAFSDRTTCTSIQVWPVIPKACQKTTSISTYKGDWQLSAHMEEYTSTRSYGLASVAVPVHNQHYM